MGSHRFQTERFMSCKSSNSNPTWFFPTWNWVPTSIWGVKKSRVYSKKRSTSRSLLIWWWSTCLSFWGCFTWIGPRHPWQRPQETSCTVVTGLGWQPWNPTGRYLILFVIGYRTSWEYDHPLCIYIYTEIWCWDRRVWLGISKETINSLVSHGWQWRELLIGKSTGNRKELVDFPCSRHLLKKNYWEALGSYIVST